MKEVLFSSHLAQTDNMVNQARNVFSPFLLALFLQPILREGIFGNSYFFDTSVTSRALQQLFQQMYFLFLQTQYRNMNKDCEKVRTFTIHESWEFVLTKKYLFLKTRGLEKVSYSKSICSRLIFCNQLFKYSLFLVSLWAVIITKERTRTPSYVAGAELT